MADPIPVGSDVSAGTYECTNCGNQLEVQSVQSMPPWPSCEALLLERAYRRGQSRRPVPGGVRRVEQQRRGCSPGGLLHRHWTLATGPPSIVRATDRTRKRTSGWPRPSASPS